MKIHDPRYQSFLGKLRTARKQAGLTQDEAAKALGKKQAFIWKCETGERRVDFVEATLFAKLYRKPITYFVP